MPVQQSSYGTPREALGAAFWEYRPDPSRFIGLQVLPEIRTSKKAATFLKVTRESVAIRANARRGPGGTYNRIDAHTEDDTYTCEEWGLEGRLPDDQRAFYASDFDAEDATTQHIYEQLMLEFEVRAAALVMNTTTWTGADLYTDVSSAPWDTAASGVIGHVMAAKEKVRLGTGGTEADTLIIGASQLPNLLQNTEIKAMFPGATLITAAMLEAALPAIFGLTRLLVGRARYNSSDEGLTYSGTDVWSDDYAMVAKIAPQGANILEPSIGRTFLWVGDSPEFTTTEEYREEQTRSDVFRVRHHCDEKIIDPAFGHLLKID